MKLRKKVSKFISYALVMMMTMSLLATPALADNAKVTYIVHHMYPNSTDINNSYQGRDDINNFFTEYDGTYAGNTLEEG